MARNKHYRGGGCHARAWGKAMKSNIQNTEQFDNYRNFNKEWAPAYKMMGNQQHVEGKSQAAQVMMAEEEGVSKAGPAKEDAVMRQADTFVHQMNVGKRTNQAYMQKKMDDLD